jgi:sugar/nucleoside kinase (ribokinase family)
LALTGERTALIYRGASKNFELVNVDDLDKVRPDWLYVSSMAGDFETLTSVLRRCSKLGIKVMLNPGKDELSKPKKLIGLLEDVDVFLANREEVQKLVPGDTLDELLMRMLSLCENVIISDGNNGVIASDGKTKVRAGIYEKVKTLDRTGAGDAFGSGFLSWWARGKSLRDSVVFASANATSVVMSIGAKTGILRKSVRLHDMPLSEVKL